MYRGGGGRTFLGLVKHGFFAVYESSGTCKHSGNPIISNFFAVSLLLVICVLELFARDYILLNCFLIIKEEVLRWFDILEKLSSVTILVI